MPARKDDVAKHEVVKVRITTLLKDRCNKARMGGARAGEAESTFLGYLIALGIAKYERVILPAEVSEDEPLAARNSDLEKRSYAYPEPTTDDLAVAERGRHLATPRPGREGKKPRVKEG